MSNKTKSYLTIVSGVIIMLMLGSAYIWSVYITPLSKHFGWDRGTASLPFSAFLICYTAGMIIGGRLQDKFGPTKVATIGTALFGLGYFASGFTNSIIYLCITYGAVAGFGTGFAYVTSVVAANKWFPHKKGLVSGIIVFGFGAGAFLLAPFTKWLISQIGWQKSFLTLGGIFTFVTVIASRFIYNAPPSGESPSTTPSKEESLAGKNFSPSQLFSNPIFYGAWMVWFLNLSVGLGAMGHIVAYAEKIGAPHIKAAFLLSVIAISNGIARIVMGALSDRIGRLKEFAMAAALMGVASFGFAQIKSINNLEADMTKLYVLSVIFGAAFGSFLVLYPTITADLFGTKYLGTNYGILFSSYGIAGIVGPIIFGKIYDATQNYSPAFMVGTFMAAAGLIVSLWILMATKSSAAAK